MLKELQESKGYIKLERDFATIPLPGIDVPFHSRYLWAGEMSSPRLDKVLKKWDQESWASPEQCQRLAYIILVELLSY
ncbi:hypothetical protein J3R83DRAFT_5113 [Lanmaoa asiatica]|nr:hypothetical protein J3R83DRAFT_5113 [Lanmaoa asiatica]